MKIEFEQRALTDLDRIFDFNLERGEAQALAQIGLIQSAVMILASHPRIGRPLAGSLLRELVIAASKDGYVALYDYDEHDRVIRVVAIKHQREAGYREG